MKRNPLSRMLRTAMAELSRAESRSLGCGERRMHLRRAVKIDDRARDYAIRMVSRKHSLPSKMDMGLIGRLNRLVPQIKRVVHASCGYR
jgi:hypothetical protein